jgi:hypothetical protein
MLKQASRCCQLLALTANSGLLVLVLDLSINAFVAYKVCKLVFLALSIIYVPACVRKYGPSRFGDHLKPYSEGTRPHCSPA